MLPFTAMILLAIVTFLFYLFFLASPATEWKAGEYFEFLIQGIIYTTLLTGDAVAYWKTRTWKMRKLFVKIHILLMYCRIFLLPYIDLQLYLDKDLERPTNKTLQAWGEELPTLYWLVPLVAHIFLALALIEAYRK